MYITQKPECNRHILQLCLGIRNLIKDVLRKVVDLMLKSLYIEKFKEQYHYHFQSYQFAFKCYLEDCKYGGMDHLCVVSDNEEEGVPKNMDHVKGGPIQMKPEHLVWYNKVRFKLISFPSFLSPVYIF